jgi:hypothetical protein
MEGNGGTEERVTLAEAEEALRRLDAFIAAGGRGPMVTSSGPFDRYAAALAAHWARKGEE